MPGLSRTYMALAARSRPRAGPLASYDFSQGALPPGLSFARASAGSHFGPDGQMALAANDVARFDHMPVTGAPRGLLLEPGGTNLLPRSADFTVAAWRKNGVTVAAQAGASPVAGLLADRIVEDGSTGRHDTEYSFGAAQPGDAYAASVFVKAEGRSRVRFRCGRNDTAESITVNLATGAASGIGYNVGFHEVLDIGGGWWRLTMCSTIDQSSAAQYLQVRLLNDAGSDSYAGSGAAGVCIWGAQLETGQRATSHTPTGGASASRAADILSLDGHEGGFDIRLTYGDGTKEELAGEALAAGWSPVPSRPHLRRIEVFSGGAP